MQEKMLKLQRVLMVHFLQLTNQQTQCLLPEDQQCPQGSQKQEKRMGYLLSQMVNLIWSEAMTKLKFKELLPHLDSEGAIVVQCGAEAGQQAPSPRQPAQLSPWLSGLAAAFVRHILSNRGANISTSYRSSFESYEAYQTDKYHKDKNSLGYINLDTSENKLCLDLITDQVVVLNGCSSVFSSVAMVLCDPGDAFLIPTLCCSGFAIPFNFDFLKKISRLPDPNKTRMIWDTSKDFGMPSFHCGVLYTHSKEVASSVKAFGYLHGVSGITQYKLSRLLQAREWINKLCLPTNHSQLREAYDYSYVTERLEELNIPFLNRGFGLFLWINLKAQEKILLQRFQKNKLLLSGGVSYACQEPGWFCLIFAENQPQLKVAMDRFCKVLNDHKQGILMEELEQAIMI